MSLAASPYRLVRSPRDDDQAFPATPAQRRVIDHGEGPLLVLGGPGTGKTVTLVEAAVAQLRAAGGPLLVLTGSAAAAGRLRDRLGRRAPDVIAAARVVSWAGLSHALVRRLADPTGGPRFLSAAESDRRVRDLLASQPEAAWPAEWAAVRLTHQFARQVGEVMAALRREGVTPADLAERARQRARSDWAALAVFFDTYLDVLALEDSLDYAELMARAVRLSGDLAHAEELRGFARVVLVDDYEELDPAQLRLLENLTGPAGNLIAFGDPRQASGVFRGATARAILDLPDRFRSATGGPVPVIELTEPQRSGAALSAVGARLAERIPLPRPWPGRARTPPAAMEPLIPSPVAGVEVVLCESPSDEATWIAERLWRAHGAGLAWSDMAIIVRTGRPITGLVAALTARDVPVAVEWAGVAMADEPVIQTLLAGLAVAALDQGSDADKVEWLRAILTSPLGGFRPDAVDAGLADPTAAIVTVWGEAEARPSVAEADAWRRGLDSLATARHLIASGQPAVDALWTLWQGTGWADRVMAATWGDAAATQGANRDLDAIGALFDLAHRLDRLGGAPGVAALLDEVNDQRVPARRVPVELGRAGVAALTAHRAKGRQWPLVVVAAVQDGVWPAARRRGSLFDLRDLTVDGRFAPPTIGEHLAAERRLFYVACTRAQDSLVVTAVDQVGSGGLAPSRFLSELGCPIVPVGPPGPTPTTWIGFIGLLRRTAADPTAHPTLRAAACLRLADLAEARDAAGRQLVPLAAPERWWGSATAVAEAPADVDSAGAPIRLSGSQVDGLLSCPRQWFLARRARAERDRSPGAVFGTLVHTLAQQLAAGVIDRPTASRRLDEVWPDIGFPAAWQGASEREQAEAALDRFEVWQHAQVDRVVLGLEVHFETSVRIGQRTVRLTGQIDRLDRTADGLVRVVDFKTAKVAPSKAEAAANHQLGVYQLAIQTGALGDLLGPTPRLSDAELVHVRLPAGVGQPGPKVARQASLDRQSHLEQPDPAALGRLTERSVGMPRDYPTWVHHRLAVGAEILAEGRYPAVAQRSCRWCQFRSSCPIQVADEEEASV